MHCLRLASVLSLFQLAVGVIVNSTVDDQNGGPNGERILYQPDTGWLQGAIGGCNGCPPPPISNIASMNTFHGSVFNHRNHLNTNQTPPTATLVFIGSSVSVNCILSDALSDPPGIADLTFLVDGIQKGTYSHTPVGNPSPQKSTVFVSEPLEPGSHTLVIQNGRRGGSSSLIILDSVTYSFDNLSTTSSASNESSSATSTAISGPIGGAAKSANTAAIAGGVIAALAVILLIALAFLYIRYRRNQHRSNVPLSTSILSPIGRIGRLWSAVQSPPKPPPDMAPVPFPSPAHHVSHTPSPRPPAPAPAAPPSPPGSRMSRISFNANLLVGRFQRRPPPPAILTRQAPGTPPNTRRSVTLSPAPPSGNPLLRPPSAQPEPHNVVASIQQWQQRTLEETANEPIPIIHPLDMSEVDLSSHYDESSISSPPPPPPAPPPRTPQAPQRRFTVMNN